MDALVRPLPTRKDSDEGVQVTFFNRLLCLIHPTADGLIRCRELIVQYRDLPLGLAEASVAATAERLDIPRLLTVDERHFRVIQPRSLSHFVLLPADIV